MSIFTKRRLQYLAGIIKENKETEELYDKEFEDEYNKILDKPERKKRQEFWNYPDEEAEFWKNREKEELKEIGWLSKTRTPPPKIAWDPKAKAEWEEQQRQRLQINKSSSSSGTPEVEKTVAPLGKIKQGGKKGQNPETLSQIFSMLQNASEDQLKQILSILQQKQV